MPDLYCVSRTSGLKIRSQTELRLKGIRGDVLMKRAVPNRFSELIEIALEGGAIAARVIPSEKIVIDERARLKCEVPRCAGYGQFLTCPPHVMSVDAFSRIRSRYQWGLLVQVEARNIDSTDKAAARINRAVLKENKKWHRPFRLQLLEIVEAVETAAFKKGMRFATGLVGGSCVLCERCVADKVSDPCRHPFRARPPMEAVGIDVIKTAQNGGLPISLSSSQNVLWTGLVLLD
jgi:predicted metal-binding protein